MKVVKYGQTNVSTENISKVGESCTCGTALLPNIPLRMARQRPTITSSLMFSMMPAASPAIRASRIGAEKRKGSLLQMRFMDLSEKGMYMTLYMNMKYISVPHSSASKYLQQQCESKRDLCHLCRGSRRGRVRLDLLWWSQHDQTG